MKQWLNEQLPSLIERITGEFYTKILGSEKPIFVDYFAPWCGHCIQFEPVLEEIAKVCILSFTVTLNQKFYSKFTLR